MEHIAILTVGDSVNWEVHRYKYAPEKVIQQLEERKPPFYKNLQNTLRYACIRNDI